MLKIIKSLIVLYFALFFSLVAYNNLVDTQTNWFFVRHVLSMDTIFEKSKLTTRALTHPLIHELAYSIIIALQLLTALILWITGIKMILKRASLKAFNVEKMRAIGGLFVGFTLYFVGFLTIASEWFLMWQSEQWNGQQTAFMIAGLLMLSILFINQRD